MKLKYEKVEIGSFESINTILLDFFLQISFIISCSEVFILVSLLSQNNKKVLFRSDNSWTWYQSFPLLDSIHFNEADSYLPILALYNPEYKSFLKMNKDGTMGLFQSEKKKLQNTLESNGVIFKVFKNDGKDGSPTTVSLYNCAAERFLQMTDKEVEGSIINRGQSIAKESIQWVPNKITDKLISLNSYAGYPAKKYITIQDKINVQIISVGP